MSQHHKSSPKSAPLQPARNKAATPIGQAYQKLQRAIAAARNLISPAIFAETTGGPLIQTMIVPVPNNGWAPAMWCGEFAVVDTTNLAPEDGAFVLRRSGTNGNLAIVRLKIWDESGAFKIVREPGEEIGFHWNIVYGTQSAYRLDGAHFAPDDLLSHFHMCDGPLPDRFMREEIVGRITGIVGHGDRAMDWRRWTDT